jgi:hypothetical protein
VADLREGQGAPPTEFAPGQSGHLGTSNADPWSHPLTVVPPADDPAPVTTQTVQAAIEGAPLLDETNSIEFLGERFKVSESIGMMPLLAYAHASSKGLDSDDMKGMAAMYAMIRDCIHRPPLIEPDFIEGEGGYADNPKAGQPQRDPDTGDRLYEETEWDRFTEHATDMKADGEELMDVIKKVMGVVAARPRKRRSDSSARSPQTSPSSKVSSSSPVTNVPLEGLTAVRDLGR